MDVAHVRELAAGAHESELVAVTVACARRSGLRAVGRAQVQMPVRLDIREPVGARGSRVRLSREPVEQLGCETHTNLAVRVVLDSHPSVGMTLLT